MKSVVLLASVIIMTLAVAAVAEFGWIGTFNSTYDAGATRLNTCNVCHIGIPGPRNQYGIDFKTKLAGLLPFGLYTIPAVSTIGLSEKEAVEAGRDVVVGRAQYRHNARGRMLGDEQGMVKCVFDRLTRRLVGATIVGESATELIHIAQFVITFEAGIDEIIGACFNYPSLSELYKYAAYDALQAIAARDREQAA